MDGENQDLLVEVNRLKEVNNFFNFFFLNFLNFFFLNFLNFLNCLWRGHPAQRGERSDGDHDGEI